MADPYATHLTVLHALGRVVPAEWVLELGAGMHSTPEFLRREVFPCLRLLLSDEPDSVWREKVQKVIGDDDRCILTNLPMEHVLIDLHVYDLILIDCGWVIADRVPVIEAIARSKPTAVVVIHDYEQLEYQRAAASFDHVLIYTHETPWTAICWNGRRPELERIKWES